MNGINFEDRTIALIGNEFHCRRFYIQFHALLNIRYFFYIKKGKWFSAAETFFKENTKVECMFIDEKVIKKENLLLILCNEHPFRSFYDTALFNMGNEWGRDYIDFLYVIQYYRQKYSFSLEEKNIWIFGAGNNGKRFYEKYKDIYHISGFVSNYSEEKECKGLPVIRPHSLSGDENSYVVICSEQDAVIAQQLSETGFCGDRDYGFESTLPKKLFIATGTCQIVVTANALYRNDDFRAHYDLCVFMDSMYNVCSDADNRRLKEYGSYCDTVFFNVVNTGSSEQRNYQYLVDDFYQNADKLFMPFYYFRGQLMQATGEENRYTVRRPFSYHLWLRGDEEVNRLVENGLTEEQILARVSGDYWTEEEIRNNFWKEMKKIEIWDRVSSFPLRPFIEENYKSLMIFSDGTHFCRQLAFYLANKIAVHLRIKPICNTGILDELVSETKSIMPVYPCVRQALGLKMADKYRFYNEEKKECEELEFKDFIKRYIQYVTQIRSIYEESGTLF